MTVATGDRVAPAWFTVDMEYTDVTPEEFDELDGLDDWRVVLDAIHATFRAPDYLAAAELVKEIAQIAEAPTTIPMSSSGIPAVSM